MMISWRLIYWRFSMRKGLSHWDVYLTVYFASLITSVL